MRILSNLQKNAYFSLIIICLFLGSISFAIGGETRSGNLVEITETEIMPGNLSVICKTLKMSGEVRGDLLAGGMYLAVENTVGEDVTLAGYGLKMNSFAGNDVRLIGANIEVNGAIKGDLVVFGGNIKVFGDVSGDVIAGGGNVWINGNVQGGLDIRCGDVFIAGTIGQNSDITASNLTLSPTARLLGSLVYTSNNDLKTEEGAQVAGSINKKPKVRSMVLWKLASKLAHWLPEKPKNWREWEDGSPAWFKVLLKISSFFSLFITGIVILALYSRHATMVADRIMSSTLKVLLWGLVFLICVPIAALILCVSIVGAPVGLIALATYLVFSYISRVYVALAIGREILDRVTKQDVRVIWQLLIGLLIITLLSSIPFYIGSGIKLICVILGLGGMLMIERRSPRSMRGT